MDENVTATEDQQGKTLQWLLEQDYAEPSEKVFNLSDSEYSDSPLTEYESEVASRPMFGGQGSTDDLSSFLDEEIVMTAPGGQGADIFSLSGEEVEASTRARNGNNPSSMAVDYSADRLVDSSDCSADVEEGSDILGLVDGDDIGERFVVIQKPVLRVARTEKPAEDIEHLQTAVEGVVEEALPTLVIEIESVLTSADLDSSDVDPALSINEIVDEQRVNTTESYDVFDYVAANEPPADDEDFDQYLLLGRNFEERDSSVDGLTVDETEGMASVDPQIETAIDYHDDFWSGEGFNSDSVGAITSAIPEVMEEISSAVAARLAGLSMEPESVEVEVLIGGDPISIEQCHAENYVPILEITTAVPAALSRLGQSEIDAIFIRLSNTRDDTNWNNLFTEDFGINVETGSDTDEVTGEIDSLAEDMSVFADDVFSTDISDEIPSFDDIGSIDLGSMVEGFDLGETLEPEEEPAAIFDEDIFSSELTEEFAGDESVMSSDVESLIESLAVVETDIGEICGVDVGQFSGSTAQTEVAGESVQAEDVAKETSEQPVAADSSWCVPDDIQFSFTSQSVAEVFTDFLDAFIEESASELEKLEDALGEWEKDIASEALYTPIPRVLHTLKGIAKSVGLQRYGTLIHNFETLLETLARPAAGQERTYFRIVNAWLDSAVRGFEHIETDRTDIASELPSPSPMPVADNTHAEAVIAVVESDKEAHLSTSPFAHSMPDNSSKDKQLADEGAKVLAAQQTIRMTPEAVDHLLSLTNEAQQLGVRSSQSTVRGKRAAAELLGRLSSVRAHVTKIADKALLKVTSKGGLASSKLDALEMDQYSELQEAANILREGVEDLDDLIRDSNRQYTIAEALLKQQASVISSLGSSIQAARVVPVSRLMPGLRRIVRNVSADLGKSVTFRVLNEAGTLDRDNHARCQIILEHMIRNALDHGIEKPQARTAVGKNPNGNITIDASKQGSNYIIALTDDGKGIDPEVMRDTAHKKGLDIDVDMLSDEEALRLIFHKGFSTAESLSEISGRGVGMDIVLSELQHIGGDIDIDSKMGEGTTFRVRIPSNVTVNGALLVAAGEMSYAVPLDGLIAVEHVPVNTFYEAIEKGSKLSLFGMDCDPAYLATICSGVTLPDRSAWALTVPVIVAGSEKRYMAIAIDDVTQALELVIRSLGAQFSTIPGLAGGATTADGQSIVALDLNALVESVATDDLSPVSIHVQTEERMLVLVVDDSRTQRMVATSQFDTLGVETITAENGLVAIDLLNTTHRLPDVILLDIEMPVKDGIQTLREIRKSGRYGDLPVIMVTSRTGAKHRSLAEAAGCNGYMGKPFNFPKLIEQISGLTNQKFQLF